MLPGIKECLRPSNWHRDVVVLGQGYSQRNKCMLHNFVDRYVLRPCTRQVPCISGCGQCMIGLWLLIMCSLTAFPTAETERGGGDVSVVHVGFFCGQAGALPFDNETPFARPTEMCNKCVVSTCQIGPVSMTFADLRPPGVATLFHKTLHNGLRLYTTSITMCRLTCPANHRPTVMYFQRS
jgi:hypothetical protein